MATRKVKDGFIKAIHFADIFNEPVYLNMNGNRKMSSSLGTLLSAALIIFLLSRGIMQSVSMFNRDGPQIYQVNELEDDPSPVFLNSTNNFMFAIQISKYSHVVNLSLEAPLSFQLTFNQYLRDAGGNRTKIKNVIYMAPCNKSNFPDEIYGEGVYERYNLALAYCPTAINHTFANLTCPQEILESYPGTDCVTPLLYTIRGAYLSVRFEFIQMNLQGCSTSKSKNNWGYKCAPSISTLITTNEHKVNLIYANNIINPTDYLKPNISYLETLYWEINPSLVRTADIYLDKEIVQDFDSLWSSDTDINSTFYSLQPSGMRELSVLNTGAVTANTLQFNIRRSSQNIVTTRTYEKIQDIMTDLGGFAQAVMFVAAIVAMGYVDYKYEMTLSNEFYDFELPQDPKKPDRRGDYIDQSGFESPKASVKGLKGVKAGKLADGESIDKVVADYRNKKMRRKNIDFNLWEYVKKVCRWITCRESEVDEIAERAKDMMEDELDIIRIIQKLKEVDKLKVLLLNRYQREVFNFIEKPLVTLENDNPIDLDNLLPDLSFELEETKLEDDTIPQVGLMNGREEFNSLSKYGKLYMAYRYLMEDSMLGKEKQIYNGKVLEMLGEDLIKVFQKVDELIEEEPDPRKFEEIIQQVFHQPEAFGG